MYLGFVFCVALFQVAASQIFSYIPRNVAGPTLTPANQQNAIGSNVIANAMTANAMAANAMTANPMAGNTNNYRAVSSNGVPLTRPAQNNIIANIPANEIAQVVENSITNANIANTQTANAAITNTINENAAMAANKAELTGTITNAELVNLANTNFPAGANSQLAALASLATINGNTATFNFGNDGHGFTVTSGSPNSQGFGIQILADALEVGGTVAVNGQIPIFGAVALNGNLPTDGSAIVHYTSGRQAAVQAAPAAAAAPASV